MQEQFRKTLLPRLKLFYGHPPDFRQLFIIRKIKSRKLLPAEAYIAEIFGFRIMLPHEGAGKERINGAVPMRIDTAPCFPPESEFTALYPARSLADRAARSR